MTRRIAARTGAIAVLVAACAAAWAVFAPPELGGSTRYAILEGTSMEPSLHAGDLALVRPAEGLEKGDVVLYESPRLGAHVLHRIARTSGDRFVLKGDNNDFLDEARPRADDIKGQLWLAIPNVGSALTWARRPLHAALIIFPLAFLALGGGAALAALRRPRDPSRPRGVSREEARTSPGNGALAQNVLTVALCGLVVFALLAVVTHTRSTTLMQSTPDAYAHVGKFSYGAEVEPSDVYPDGLVDTGEAAFLQLVPSLDVAFSYRLDAKDVSGARGTTQLRAVVSDGAGWSRELVLAEPQGFVGPAARAEGRLDLAELAAIVEEMKTLTGSGTSTFALGIEADVEVRGRVAGEPVAQAFSADLPLLLDPISVRPDLARAGSSPFVIRRGEAAEVSVPSSLALGGLRLPVAQARRLAVLGFLLAGLVAAIAGAVLWRRRTDAELSQMASLFGDRLITISRPPSISPQRVTELTDAESLQRVAEHHDRIVLHWREGRDYVYEVTDGGLAYRYRAGLGIEPGLHEPNDADDTLVMPPAKLPPRAAAG